MKILVVEDDMHKLRHVTTALSGVPGVDVTSDITHRADVASALQAMHATRFDLLVLDIILPVRVDQPATPDAGLRLLDELLQRSRYQVPGHVVGLTAHDDAFSAGSQRFTERLLTLIRYDPSSTEWANQLQARSKHILLAGEAERRDTTFQSLICVVCALDAPELEHVRRIPWSWEQVTLPGDYTIYYRGQIPRGGQHATVYAAAAARMGMPAAAALTMKMVAAFRPQFVGMTGITAAVRGRAQYGDVLVADPSWDWGSGKLVVRNDSQAFLAAPHQLPLAAELRQKMQQVAKDAAFLSALREQWPADKPESTLAVRIGPVASGASVLADGATAVRVAEQHRNLLGIEMETYGVFAAAAESPAPQPQAFSIKSVVDYADGNKDDKYQQYAAHTSARVLQYLAEQLL